MKALADANTRAEGLQDELKRSQSGTEDLDRALYTARQEISDLKRSAKQTQRLEQALTTTNKALEAVTEGIFSC